MPFAIVRNDITGMQVDAIVNSANPRPVVGAGTDSRIHEKAGPGLLEARKEIGDIAAGQAALTPAFCLRAKYVIHTVGPVWEDGSYGEETNDAVAKFQRAKGLDADGSAGPLTQPVLFALASGSTVSSSTSSSTSTSGTTGTLRTNVSVNLRKNGNISSPRLLALASQGMP